MILFSKKLDRLVVADDVPGTVIDYGLSFLRSLVVKAQLDPEQITVEALAPNPVDRSQLRLGINIGNALVMGFDNLDPLQIVVAKQVDAEDEETGRSKWRVTSFPVGGVVTPPIREVQTLFRIVALELEQRGFRLIGDSGGDGPTWSTVIPGPISFYCQSINKGVSIHAERNP